MSEIYRLTPGDAPLIVNVPHDGGLIPEDIAATMTGVGRRAADRDWYVNELYRFARDLGATVLSANYSRYVVDLNRPASDETLYEGQIHTGLCPVESFHGEPLYEEGRQPDQAEVDRRITRFWQPYHDRLTSLIRETVGRHGRAVLWDAHSIARRLPRLFAGDLPDLNVGTFSGRSCSAALADGLLRLIETDARFTFVANGRFIGGYNTRHYSDPGNRVEAVQMELVQDLYLDSDGRFDAQRAAPLQALLYRLLETCL